MTISVENRLKQKLPYATEAECRRFLKACQLNDECEYGAAEKALKDYLEWRKCYGMDDSMDSVISSDTDRNFDAKLWVGCSHRARISLKANPEEYQERESLGRKKQGKTQSKSTRKGERTEVEAKSFLENVPQFVFLRRRNSPHAIVDRQGNKILHVLPAMIDTKNVLWENTSILLR